MIEQNVFCDKRACGGVQARMLMIMSVAAIVLQQNREPPPLKSLGYTVSVCSTIPHPSLKNACAFLLIRFLYFAAVETKWFNKSNLVSASLSFLRASWSAEGVCRNYGRQLISDILALLSQNDDAYCHDSLLCTDAAHTRRLQMLWNTAT